MSESTSELRNERSGPAELTESDRHRLLSDGRRRILLDVLEGRPTPVELDDAAAAVARREANGSGATAELREGVAIALHHNHLPRMADMGVIDYDPESRRISTV